MDRRARVEAGRRDRAEHRDAESVATPAGDESGHGKTTIGKPPEPPAKAPERSAEFKRLVELRAYVIWVNRGRPTGQAGESVKEKNWLEAERQILRKSKPGFKIWDQQGRPTGEAGEAVREKNMRAAEAPLLKETEEEMRRHPTRLAFELLVRVNCDSSIELREARTHGS